MLVEIEFDFYYGSSWPELTLQASNLTDLNITTISISEYVNTVTYKFSTNSRSIVFTNSNKKDADTIIENSIIVRDQYLKIKKIWIDNILLDLNLVKPYIAFAPVYSQGYLDYCNNNNIVPNAVLHDTAFYFNGKLEFSFNQPFWDWYANLRREQILQNFSGSDLTRYFGIDDPEVAKQLEKLKTLLQSHV